MAAFKDITGKTFGKLTAIKYIAATGKARGKWLCQCQCGKASEVFTGNLTRGFTSSCGCSRVDKITKHGAYKTPEYQNWECMKSRCYRVKNKRYKFYGGRGITVCDRWKDSFANFLKDMGPRPEGRGTIDRISNNGNYEPGNCQWASREEQNNNTSRSRYITYKGQTHTMKTWCDILGASKHVFKYRVDNWSLDKVFNTPFPPLK